MSSHNAQFFDLNPPKIYDYDFLTSYNKVARGFFFVCSVKT